MTPTAIHEIPSDRLLGMTYRVSAYADGTFTCTCPDYTHRHAARQGACKHIRRLIAGQRAVRVEALLAQIDDLYG